MNIKNFSLKKDASLAHQVIKLARFLNETGLANVRKRYGIPNLKQAHLDLFPHIDFDGTSISEIARRKGVSKQAISKVVSELESMGVLSLRPAPTDARSKRVFFQTSGPFAIQKGFKELQNLDILIQKTLGGDQYLKTLQAISRLIDEFDTKEL